MLTNTNSLFYEIKTEGVYKDLYEKQEDQIYFDTCDYPKNSKYIFLKKIYRQNER